MLAISTRPNSSLTKARSCGPVVVMGSFFATMMLQICLAVIMASSLVCRGSGHAVSNLLGQFSIIAKLEDHDIRVLIFGMGREVARFRHLPVLSIPPTNRHDLPRTVQ